MLRAPTSRSSLSLMLLVGLSLGCAARRDAPLPVPSDAAEAVVVPAEPDPALTLGASAVREHVTFLADDAQEGRPPGGEADGRVQAYIEAAFAKAGLQPAFGSAWRQSFELTDGVAVIEGAALALTVGGAALAPTVLPFSTDTSSTGPVQAKLVFVGHGIAGEGPGTGDYAGLAQKVKGSIVVALDGGPNDPHLEPLKLRPQSKLIAARDHGAVGFVLWDPASDVPYPNHGQVNDLALPALFVGKAGNDALTAALPAARKSKAAATGSPRSVAIDRGAVSRKPATIHTPIRPITLTTANVAGVLPGSGAQEGMIVLGAHMDHLGYGTRSSLAPGERAIHNGADDNASGVAVLLELARTVALVPVAERRYDTLFVAFGAEELGLLGSKHFVEHAAEVTPERIVAMLNFDMVGRLRPEEGLTVSGAGTSSVWPELIASHRGALTVKTVDDGYGPSDHGSFYEAGVPVLHFFTGGHADYHKPSDDVATLNVEGAVQVGQVAQGILAALLGQSLAIDYKQTARTTPQGGGRGFRVSLGTVPDYAAQVDGVRLSGVRPGGPADAAGLKQGDVITKIGAREVHNLDDFMATFGELTPGTAVPVEILREGQALTLTLTPSAPQQR